MKVSKERFKRILMSAFIIITTIQLFFIQNPSIYNLFRYSSLIVLIFLVIIMGRRFFYCIDQPVIKYFLFANILNIFSVLVIGIIVGTIYFSQISLLMIPFLVLIVSYDIEFKKEDIIKLLNVSSFTLALLGLFVIFRFGSGFIITDRYFFGSKNQIGIPMALMVIYLFYCMQYKIANFSTSRHINNFINFGLATTIFYSLLIIRNRTSIIGILLVIMLLLLRTFSYTISFKRLLTSIILFSIMWLMVYFEVITNPITLFVESMTGNYSINDLDNLSAGRIGRLIDGLAFVFNEAPFLGDSNRLSGIRSPHMFVVYQWTQFGLFFSLPAILFYAYLWVQMFLGIFSAFRKKNTLVNLGYWMLVFSLFSSFLEYNHPFGPGTSFVLLWFLLAYTIKNREGKRSEYAN